MKKIWVCADYSQAEVRVVAWAGPVPALKTWFSTGEDVHLNVAKMIGKVAQTAKLNLPGGLFTNKSYNDFTAEDPERQIAKNTVHGNNYDLGKYKFALITGLPVKHAALVQEVYHGLFPEIRKSYHANIISTVKRTRTLTNPWGARRVFYGDLTDETFRAAYAWYPQSTVGLLLVNTLCEVCEVFDKEIPENVVVTPEVIRSMGLDVRMQVHDSINVIVPDSEDAINFTCKTIKEKGEIPLTIRGDNLVIPMDFQIGPNLAKKSLRKYKVVV